MLTNKMFAFTFTDSMKTIRLDKNLSPYQMPLPFTKDQILSTLM